MLDVGWWVMGGMGVSGSCIWSISRWSIEENTAVQPRTQPSHMGDRSIVSHNAHTAPGLEGGGGELGDAFWQKHAAIVCARSVVLWGVGMITIVSG